MKSITDKINEGFFKNVGASFPWTLAEWFDNVPVCFGQYLTKYDEKKIKKDSNSFTITFFNNYKKSNELRNVYLDLSPYIGQLMQYDPKKCVIEFDTGLYTNIHGVKINNTERRETEMEKKGYDVFDKFIKITIKVMPGENPVYGQKDIINGREYNKMLKYSRKPQYMSVGSYYKALNSGIDILLELAQYVEDFPHDKNGWTVINNNLK